MIYSAKNGCLKSASRMLFCGNDHHSHVFAVIAFCLGFFFFFSGSNYIEQRANNLMALVDSRDLNFRFMASLMQGYTAYLRPIRCAPRCVGATDTGSLFDLDAFLHSRDR